MRGISTEIGIFVNWYLSSTFLLTGACTITMSFTLVDAFNMFRLHLCRIIQNSRDFAQIIYHRVRTSWEAFSDARKHYNSHVVMSFTLFMNFYSSLKKLRHFIQKLDITRQELVSVQIMWLKRGCLGQHLWYLHFFFLYHVCLFLNKRLCRHFEMSNFENQ